MNYRSSAEEADALVKDIVAKGGKAKAYKADVADFAAVQAMVGDIVKDFGGLNFLSTMPGWPSASALLKQNPTIGIARSTPASTARSIAATPRRRISMPARTAASSA